jgi:hypothetical protein
VTGAKEGRADDPKIPLKNFSMNAFFLLVQVWLDLEANMKASLQFFQGDIAGPYKDLAYKNFVEGHCATNGWHWEPQAAQMPHMNVLDLSAFSQ